MTGAVRDKIKTRVGKWFFLCPARHIILILGVFLTALYYLLRSNGTIMQFFTKYVIKEYHRLAGSAFSTFSFSVAEWLYALVIVAGIVYIIYKFIIIIRSDIKLKNVYITIISLSSCGIAIYAVICILWGSCYYGEGFSDMSGLAAGSPDSAALAGATRYFAETAGKYAGKISRDENGLFNEDIGACLDKGARLYDNVSEVYPFLNGPDITPKPMVFSKILSHMNFTGFFFAPTGEANINIDAPACMIPATIAHEIAHQRGIASEDEANFVGILAAMESGDDVYIYSASLMAYTYVSNTLRDTDYDAWTQAYAILPESVRADLRSVSEYWGKYKTKAADASGAVYSGFLRSQGEVLGMRSYGACVDLLSAYYGGEALGAGEDKLFSEEQNE